MTHRIDVADSNGILQTVMTYEKLIYEHQLNGVGFFDVLVSTSSADYRTKFAKGYTIYVYRNSALELKGIIEKISHTSTGLMRIQGIGYGEKRLSNANAPNEIWMSTNTTGPISRAQEAVSSFSLAGSDSQGIAFDSSGCIWSSDNTTHKIYKMDSVGSLISSIQPDSSDYSIRGIDFDSAGCIWYADNTGTIYKSDTSGTTVSSFSSPSTSAQGISIDTNDSIWHSDYATDVIYKLDTEGNVLTSFSSPSTEPKGLSIDLNGCIWVSDSNTDKVYKMNQVGSIVTSISSPSSSPAGLFIDSDFTVWCVDNGTDEASEMKITKSLLSNCTGITAGTIEDQTVNSFRSDVNESCLESVDRLCKLTGQDWSIDYTNDELDIEDHKGSATSVKTFVGSIDAIKVTKEEDDTGIIEKVTIIGKNDGGNQITGSADSGSFVQGDPEITLIDKSVTTTTEADDLAAIEYAIYSATRYVYTFEVVSNSTTLVTGDVIHLTDSRTGTDTDLRIVGLKRTITAKEEKLYLEVRSTGEREVAENRLSKSSLERRANNDAKTMKQGTGYNSTGLSSDPQTHDDGTLATDSHGHGEGTLATDSHGHGTGTLATDSHDHDDGTLATESHGHDDGTLATESHDHSDGTLATESHGHDDGTLSVDTHAHSDGTLVTEAATSASGKGDIDRVGNSGTFYVSGTGGSTYTEVVIPHITGDPAFTIFNVTLFLTSASDKPTFAVEVKNQTDSAVYLNETGINISAGIALSAMTNADCEGDTVRMTVSWTDSATVVGDVFNQAIVYGDHTHSIGGKGISGAAGTNTAGVGGAAGSNTAGVSGSAGSNTAGVSGAAGSNTAGVSGAAGANTATISGDAATNTAGVSGDTADNTAGISGTSGAANAIISNKIKVYPE